MPLCLLEGSAGLNELASHPCAAVTPSVLERVPNVTTLTALTRLAKPEFKVAC
jgi:hypothetical protein